MVDTLYARPWPTPDNSIDNSTTHKALVAPSVVSATNDPDTSAMPTTIGVREPSRCTTRPVSAPMAANGTE